MTPPIPWAVQYVPWPKLGDAQPDMVTSSDAALAEHFLWNIPALLWLTAGVPRVTPRAEHAYWDAEDAELIERLGDVLAWFSSPQRDAQLAFYGFVAARAIRCLPELLAVELHRRGAASVDARLAIVRKAAREIGWRPTTLRRFASRQVPFHPITAALVCRWLLRSWRSSTGSPGNSVDERR